MLKVFDGIPKKRIVLDFMFVCVWSLLNCYFIELLASLTESVLNGADKIPQLILFYVLFLLGWELWEFVSDVHSEFTANVIENNVQWKYFNRIYYIKPSVLKNNNTGYISGLLTKLVHQQSGAYSQIVMFMPLAIVYVIYFIYQLGTFHFTFGLALFLLIGSGTIFRIIGNTLVKPRIHALTSAEANRNKMIVDTVTNIGTVQKMQASEFINKKMEKEVKECSKRTIRYSTFNEIFFCGFKFLVYAYVPVCLFIYYYILKSNLENSSGFFSLLAVVSVQIVHISKNIARTFAVYARFKGTRDKIDLIVNDENVRQQLEKEEFTSADIIDLDYTYDDKYTKNTIHIRIPEFHVDKGDVICIHGESGQGKTTLLHVLSGEIESDCVYLNENKTDKRIECVFIAQDTEILDMSIKDNLTLGNENITDEMLIKHLEAVGLKDWFDCQEKGLDTILGERGVFVSTGQRQRLNLIRGLLINNKEVYLLDEPTSNVDDETEDIMIELIKKSLKDKTVIIVTHKPKIKSICNHSYKFANGILSKEY